MNDSDRAMYERIRLERHQRITEILTHCVQQLPKRTQYSLRLALSNETACVGPILATIVNEIAPTDAEAANL